ncbi:MAG: hypothetical protein J6Y85_02550 [Alphaproteobacteria bacterium]|nr:hypothetical protein [Alphaproteobacteria bacterium]
MPSLIEAALSQGSKFALLQNAIDQKMCAIFWHVPPRGCYKEIQEFYEAIKTPQDTLNTLNDLRQVSSDEFYMHKMSYLRGAIAAIAWHTWQPEHIQDLIHVGTWFLMSKKLFKNGNYTSQLKTLLRVIENKINHIAGKAPKSTQAHWEVMKSYWKNQFVHQRKKSVRMIQDERSLA